MALLLPGGEGGALLEETLKMKIRALFLGAAVLAVAACGQGTGHRALTGGGIGAGVGAVGSAVMGANPVTGALIGGGVGAATGALTSPDQIDLDK